MTWGYFEDALEVASGKFLEALVIHLNLSTSLVTGLATDFITCHKTGLNQGYFPKSVHLMRTSFLTTVRVPSLTVVINQKIFFGQMSIFRFRAN